jgi:hypothetical protein
MMHLKLEVACYEWTYGWKSIQCLSLTTTIANQFTAPETHITFVCVLWSIQNIEKCFIRKFQVTILSIFIIMHNCICYAALNRSSPDIVIKRVGPLLCIQKVRIRSRYRDESSWLFHGYHSPSGKMTGYCPEINYHHLLLHVFQFINHPICSRLYSLHYWQHREVNHRYNLESHWSSM